MFFGLTNSLTIFHIMINELLKDLTNMEQVANFIDEILVGTESKEEHNELIKEILIRIEKIDLYIMLEMCKWKVRKVGFLEVVIRPNIKI